ncbi:MAG: TolC family protein [Flavobacteriales bacterium]
MKRFLVPALAFIFPAISFSQNAYTLQQAVEYAQTNNIQSKNATLDIAIQQARVKEIRSMGLPQVNGDVSLQNFITIPTTVIPAQAFNPFAAPGDILAVQFGTDYNVSASITATQLIFDGSYFVGLKAAKELMKMQTTMQEKTAHDIRVETMRAYYMAVVAEENIKTIESTLVNLDKLRAETEAINKEGLIEKQDVDQFTLTVDNMRNNLQRAKNMRDIAYQMLKLQMGLEINAEITLAQDAATLLSDSAATAAGNIDVAKTYEHVLLDQQLGLNELNLQNKKMKSLPSVGLFFTHQYSAMRFEFDIFENKPWYPMTVWGLKVSIPIFGSGRLSASSQQSRLESEKIRNTMKMADEGAKIQLANATLNISFAQQNLETQKKSMELSADIEKKTLVKYKEGVIGSLELNQAQMQYLSAQGNYIQALLNLFNARCEMEKLRTEPVEEDKK